MRKFSFNRRISLRRISLPKKKFILPVLFIIILASLVLASKSLLQWFTSPSSNAQNTQYDLPSATKTLNLNKEFSFPLTDDKGQKVSDIKYTIQNAELRDEIIVQGKRATSVKGRTFLIINLKIDNNFNKSVQINTRDYIRLSVNGDDKNLLAADIHNDPVEVQAISVKYTRLGFPINVTDKNIKLKVGEINGTKQDINLNF